MRKKAVIFIFVFFGLSQAAYGAGIDKYETIDRPAMISPDYNSIVIPPNIAPLNFMVKEEGSRYLVKIYSQNGEGFEVAGKSAKIQIPDGKWHKLLEQNKGNELHFDIFVKTKTQGWVRFDTITNKIAIEDAGSYVAFRRTHPTFTLTRGQIAVYQRNLGSFDEKVVMENNNYKAGCTSCHTFYQYRPDEMLLGVRNVKYGAMTLYIKDGVVNKIGAKIGYTAWHPSGKIVLYSLNNLPMFFHSANPEVRDTVDMDSVLAYYVIDSKTVKTAPEISRKDLLETWPAWSADGKYLYYCISPLTWMDKKKVPPKDYDKVKYDLVQISYDIDTDKWGEIKTVLSAEDTGLSIAMPRISPDGRWLMFCMCAYGCFPPWQPSSDLYMMDLKAAEQTGKYEYRRLELNSDKSEGWHSWSSNSRWIVFSSKRDNGLFTRIYISYIDEQGRASKPLVLPKKDPQYYDYCLDALTNAEFVSGPIAITGERLAEAIRSAGISVEMPLAITKATPTDTGGATYEELE